MGGVKSAFFQNIKKWQNQQKQQQLKKELLK